MSDETTTAPATDEEIRSLEAQLEAERAKLDELELARERRLKATRLRAELDETQRAAREAGKVEELEEKHGELGKKIAKVDTGLGMVVVRRPNHLHFQRYQDKGKSDTAALMLLVVPCLLHPTKAEFGHMIEEEPASLMRVANAVCALAGIRKSDVEGK